jgi:hypothetical protein
LNTKGSNFHNYRNPAVHLIYHIDPAVHLCVAENLIFFNFIDNLTVIQRDFVLPNNVTFMLFNPLILYNYIVKVISKRSFISLQHTHGIFYFYFYFIIEEKKIKIIFEKMFYDDGSQNIFIFVFVILFFDSFDL